jgi:acetylornithine deacetylase
MAPVLVALQRYAEQVAPRMGNHPLLGPATLSVGLISGGVSVNTVPDRCVIEIDRRLLPGEEPRDALRHVQEFLEDQLGETAGLEHGAPMLASAGLSERENGPLAEQLCGVIEGVTGSCARTGVPYGTNAPLYAAAGVPTVVFGPGSIEQAHTADEWVDVEQLHQATEVLYQFAASYGR